MLKEAGIITVSLLLLSIMNKEELHTDFAKLKVTGSIHPIVAKRGEDVTLSCHLSPETYAKHMKVRWFQVHFFHPGHMEVDMNRKPIAEDKRILMEPAAINKGTVTLKIFHVDTLDNGQYWCRFEQNGIYQEASLELKVAGLGSSPQIYLKGNKDGRLQLVCTSEGWFPQPLMWWRVEGGENLSALWEDKIQDINGLFHVETSVMIRNDSMSNVICSIYNPLLGQELSASYIPESPPLGMIPSWKTLMLTLGIFLIATTGVFTWHQRYKRVNCTLDSKTAHPELIISEKGRCVTRGNMRQNLPDNPQRFNFLPSVLGQKKITSGKHYWEVEVGPGSGWFLGICREDVNRTRDAQVTPENGFWIIGSYGNDYWAITSPSTLLSLRISPHKIGVFLDYHLGHLSFQNVTDGSHIHTFHITSFSGTLRPFFLLWSPDCNVPSGILHRLGGAQRTTSHKSEPVPSSRNSASPKTLPLATGDQDSYLTPNFLISSRKSISGSKRCLVTNPVTFIRILFST